MALNFDELEKGFYALDSYKLLFLTYHQLKESLTYMSSFSHDIISETLLFLIYYYLVHIIICDNLLFLT